MAKKNQGCRGELKCHLCAGFSPYLCFIRIDSLKAVHSHQSSGTVSVGLESHSDCTTLDCMLHCVKLLHPLALIASICGGVLGGR